MTPQELERALSRAVRDPGAVIGRRLGPSWGEGNDGYAEEQEDLWAWIVRALVHTVEPQRAELAAVIDARNELWIALNTATAEIEQARQLVAQYAPIAVPILADIKARKERAARMAAHTHYCWTCSDGTAPGAGCHNCRNTGMDQTPCIGCPGPQPAAEPSGAEAGHG